MKPILVALMLGSCAAPAYSQQPGCDPTPQAYARLAGGYGESRQSIGVDPQGNIVETWANAETWTILVTLPAGVSCVAAAGEAFQIAPPTVPGDPA